METAAARPKHVVATKTAGRTIRSLTLDDRAKRPAAAGWKGGFGLGGGFYAFFLFRSGRLNCA
jgi:hypothetical protein